MSNLTKKFYISTAIPYVNAEPHIGFAFELVQTDVIARYHRLLGEDVFFLTGTDENALKNVLAAEDAGITTKTLVDRNAGEFKELTGLLHVSNDDFIRTTEDRHIRGAQKLWHSCKQDDIYKKSYEGLYCIGCEEFYKESDLANGLCPEHKTKPQKVAEENYFFRLSRYQKQLDEFIASDTLKIIPETRKNEMLSFIRRGLEDFSISRSNDRARNWGVPVPGDPNQRIYVWIDALSNYINALGYADNAAPFHEFWQENDDVILHCIGKGITRFHAIYWPAILLSAGVRLPKVIFVHGYLTVEGEKMSKSLGNVVSPKEVVAKYGVDSLRYYLLREISSTEDGDFNQRSFEAHYNGDLANGLGNLAARVLTLASKFTITNLPAQSSLEPELMGVVTSVWGAYRISLDAFKFNDAVGAVWKLVAFCNEYVNREKPWEGGDASRAAVENLLFSLGHIASLLQPFLPETSNKIFSHLGIDPQSTIPWRDQKLTITKGESLFPRL